jgi:probable F420-dependent oxidoreductase
VYPPGYLPGIKNLPPGFAQSMSTHNTLDVGRIGVWRGEAGLSAELVVEFERLGYRAVWVGGSPSGDLTGIERLLAATSTIRVATGIVNIWQADPAVTAESFHRIEAKHPGRFLLGIGAGHPEATKEFTKPYAALVDYLGVLDAHGVPVDRRVLAALGPKVVKLAGERTAGAHPYLVTPEHTRQARELLGPDKLLAPEQKVVFAPDREQARAIGDETLGFYLVLQNYVANLRRLGFTDEDFEGKGSDRLFDGLILYGDAAKIATGIRAHLDAGADHVAIQVLGDDDPVPAYRELAKELASELAH